VRKQNRLFPNLFFLCNIFIVLVIFDFSYCRDAVVIKTAIQVLGDLTDTLGSSVGSLIQQNLTSTEFLNKYLTSDDHMIKESAEWVKLAMNRAISV
jgi:hypothetical protein